MSFDHLPEDQARRAEQLFASLKASTEHDLKAIAELLATRPDDRLFGQPSSISATSSIAWEPQALQTAAEQRKKGGTKAPA